MKKLSVATRWGIFFRKRIPAEDSQNDVSDDDSFDENDEFYEYDEFNGDGELKLKKLTHETVFY